MEKVNTEINDTAADRSRSYRDMAKYAVHAAPGLAALALSGTLAAVGQAFGRDYPYVGWLFFLGVAGIFLSLLGISIWAVVLIRRRR